ncbi:MAG: helicase-related protein [Nitrosomonas sp.]|uniref:helicase-related protein n=1 Tax=Pseudomonadati TaxID=3379134 RepID=UPI002717959B|nr:MULTISPECIES: helicase-related protein [Bacteria]MDO8995742.1 helicase-related protein [Sediminibacterium sp.]MDP3664451.1 helicase-related protein [Nitrosomonas sp.]MDZ4104734.1 helicase-related protein [Nitrosomonas sp.]
MEIIDNINHLLGDNLKRTIKSGSKLKIAASCFSIYAFEALKNELEDIESLEFIFTSPTFIPSEVNDKFRKEHRQFHIPKAERERSFYGSEFEIQLKNKLTQRAIARECADWVRRKATFRSNRGTAPMQQFAGVQDAYTAAIYMPLHGFTAVDLGYQHGDAVSNIVNKFEEPAHTGVFLNLFDQIWNDQEKLEDVTARICDHIASVYQENAPERIYFLMLYNIFSEFLEDLNEDDLPNDRTGYQESLIWQKLFNFQKDAATGIINKLETYNGCILADSVGLGKTFTALAVIKYYELRNRSVLVLCPKKLADNWLNYSRNLTTNIFAKDRFNYDVLCHTDLQRTSGESFGTPLNRINWGNYDLVVIDESHNFRNNDVYKDRETRYQKLMNSVIKQGVKTKVLMLSATPVNNRFNDLRNQLALAYEGDPDSLNKKLRTQKDIDEIFRKAQQAFNNWSTLPPEERTANAILSALDFDFFELLDSVTIARSRKHIETFYDTKDIGKFPNRLKPLSFHCQLTQRHDVIGFNEIFNQLSMLKLSVYAPVSYILPSRLAKYEALYDTEVGGGRGKLKQADRERNLQALMTINLLKRLESSVQSFRLTLKKLKDNHSTTLEKIDVFEETGKDATFADTAIAFENTEPDDDELPDIDDAKIGGKVQISLSDMDLPSWKHDLEADLLVINALLSEMLKIIPADDAKLQHLKAQINSKLAFPINPGNKKVLIFTAFADTANYLYEYLADSLWQSHQIYTGKVTGSDSPISTLKSSTRQGYDFQSLLTLFSPRSKEKALTLPNEPRELDILIGTDCISEGQNLQDCDYVINYDIHWNPVRIIQRFGRIDRIGSQNASIQLVNYWPDITLDEYINLKERVENRMVIADVTATADDNVLNTQSNDVSYRKEQLRRLQEEVIEMEDLKTGVSITDLGLNDFRMDLLNYIKANGDLANLPSGMNAVVPADPARGLPPGVMFTLRNRNNGVNINQHNRLHPYYLIYIGQNGEVIADHTEVKRLLDLVRSACKGQSQPLPEVCRLFSQATDDGRKMTVYSNLLDQAIRSMVDIKEDKDIDSLFSGGRTTALINTIAGLDDFELIAFLGIQATE